MNRPFNRRIIRTGPAVAYGVAGVSGVAALLFTLVGMLIPMRLIESASFNLYLDKLVAAAAPPFGWTARIIVVALLALVGWFVGRALARRYDVHDSGYRVNFYTMLNALRGVGKEDDPDAPALRAADRHPDAPARRPFSVKRDVPKRDWDLAPSNLPTLSREAEPVEDEDEDDLILDTSFLDDGNARSNPSDAGMTAEQSPEATSDVGAELRSGAAERSADANDASPYRRFGIEDDTVARPAARNQPDYYLPTAMPTAAQARREATRRGAQRGAPIYPDRDQAAPRPDALSIDDLYPARPATTPAAATDAAAQPTAAAEAFRAAVAAEAAALPPVTAFMPTEDSTPPPTPPLRASVLPTAPDSVLPGFDEHGLFEEPDLIAPGFLSLDPPARTSVVDDQPVVDAVAVRGISQTSRISLESLTPPAAIEPAPEPVAEAEPTPAPEPAPAVAVAEDVEDAPLVLDTVALDAPVEVADAPVAAPAPAFASRVEPEPIDLSVARLDDLLARLEAGIARRRPVESLANGLAAKPVANDVVPPVQPRVAPAVPAAPPQSAAAPSALTPSAPTPSAPTPPVAPQVTAPPAPAPITPVAAPTPVIAPVVTPIPPPPPPAVATPAAATSPVVDPDFVLPEDPALAAALATLRRMRQHVG